MEDACHPQSESYVIIKLKNRNERSELKVSKSECGEETFLFLCRHLRIPPEKIRLVCRGKIVTKDNLSSFIANGAIFQAFGEEAEDETGLDVRDIEVLMNQLSVERNVAVKALRKTGDLIDAILYVSENL
ncbi:nascent polypeptide-associated complex subunit alpha-like [Bufo gargarizans]|uniref:nascent polypeptide-associated complex subunit alpha-like n=1 Tax=Bufo gargarizans TaxID=30331 RepID=UPI001CF1E5D0|nr:nascent polypeptide-associated complex subunit alpha-like [Bufo gargarizans]